MINSFHNSLEKDLAQLGWMRVVGLGVEVGDNFSEKHRNFKICHFALKNSGASKLSPLEIL